MTIDANLMMGFEFGLAVGGGFGLALLLFYLINKDGYFK